MQKFKRTAAFITAVAMTFLLFPTATLASNEQDLEANVLTEDYIYSEGLSSQYLTASDSLIETEELVEADGLVEGYGAFYDCENLADVIVKNETPPNLYENENNIDDTFTNCSSELEIHIPVGTKAAYKETPWSDYTLKCSCYISGTLTNELRNPISNIAVTICDESEN